MDAGLHSLIKGGHGGILAGRQAGRKVPVTQGGCAKAQPVPARKKPGPASPAMALHTPQQTLTLLKAVPGDGALANEVVLGGGIIVLHNKADKGKLRHNHFKLELCVPPWVEA